LKKYLAFILALMIIFSNGCSSTDSSVEESQISDVSEAVSEEYKPIENIYGNTITVEMKIKDFGIMKIELYPEEAPETVRNFVSLVNDEFYNGLTIHRVVAGFIIQGGDPSGTGYGQAGLETIKGEFYANGYTNRIPHKKGVISMARKSGDYNSATTQFFICAATSDVVSDSLDQKYAAFGCVTSGIYVVDLVSGAATASNEMPVNQIFIEYVKVIGSSYSEEQLERFLSGESPTDLSENTEDETSISNDESSNYSEENSDLNEETTSSLEELSGVKEEPSIFFEESCDDSADISKSETQDEVL
jgi:peptidyl-prolyl cis-trans isomerase B (cyclophilin B)